LAEQTKADIDEDRKPRHQIELLKDDTVRTRRRFAARVIRPCCCISWPKRTISPLASATHLSIGARPAIAPTKVDLPLPEAPIRATISPRPNEKETSRRIGRRPSKDFEIRRTSTTASDITAAPSHMLLG
jgi:hypothetical protein